MKKNTKKILLCVYLLGFIVSIFFTDSKVNYLNIFSPAFLITILLFLVPIAMLYFIITPKIENYFIMVIDSNNVKEGDYINSENLAFVATFIIMFVLLIITLLVSANLSEKYRRIYVNKQFIEPQIKETKHFAMYRDLSDVLAGLDSSTNIYCLTLVLSGEQRTYRVCCQDLHKVPQEKLKDLLRIRISQRNKDYFYPVCPTEDEINMLGNSI